MSKASNTARELLAVYAALEDAERALSDAERIIESRSGEGSWVGSLVLVRVRDVLSHRDYEEPIKNGL